MKNLQKTTVGKPKTIAINPRYYKPGIRIHTSLAQWITEHIRITGNPSGELIDRPCFEYI
jgi:hypothetical protein